MDALSPKTLTVRSGVLHLLHHSLAAALQPLDVERQLGASTRRHRVAQRVNVVLHALQALAIAIQFDAQPLLAEQLTVDGVG